MPQYTYELVLYYLPAYLPLRVALPGIYVGYCEKLVRLYLLGLRMRVNRPRSFAVSDIKRTIDAMSWVKVRSSFIPHLVARSDLRLD
jgi:hypothetical protein